MSNQEPVSITLGDLDTVTGGSFAPEPGTSSSPRKGRSEPRKIKHLLGGLSGFAQAWRNRRH
jgi:hypothetical protein